MAYDHTTALLSAVASIVLFLLPALTFNPSSTWNFALPAPWFRWLPEAILCFAVAILIISASRGFRFGGFNEVAKYRTELAQSRGRLLEYAIGNLNGALIPFAFACFLARKRWVLLAAACVIALLFYPITLNKTTFFVAPYLIFVAVVSKFFEARWSVVLTLLIPLIISLVPIPWTDMQSKLFTLLNFRMIATPSISLEHYFAFFSNHPLTEFCQISFLKPFVSCPYTDQLGVVFSNQYGLGNMNASLFATEGIASVGPVLAPISALACGLVIATGSKASAGLPSRFILISGAIIPHILLDVPLSTTLLTNGLGLLMVLWLVTPRGRQLDLVLS